MLRPKSADLVRTLCTVNCKFSLPQCRSIPPWVPGLRLSNFLPFLLMKFAQYGHTHSALCFINQFLCCCGYYHNNYILSHKVVIQLSQSCRRDVPDMSLSLYDTSKILLGPGSRAVLPGSLARPWTG